ncbi:MAG TPA: hypothetical protein VNJ46_01665, partial [Gaiellaceae bacterium]|nr:hypothetical protein [Gaiellaceae bacterium]
MPRSRTLRTLAAALAVLALAALVAVAAGGPAAAGSDETRRPGEAVLDTVYTLVLLAYVPGLALLVYGLLQRRAIAREIATGRYPRTSLAAFLAFTILFAAVAYLLLRRADFRPPPGLDALEA